MKQYVDIQGSGELTTKITFTGSASATTGTLIGAYNAELRFLTVENSGGGSTYAIALYNSGAAPRLTHMTASATGGTNAYAIYSNGSSPKMTNITASASGTTESAGLYNTGLSQPTMRDVTITASGGTNAYGIFNNGSWLWIKESIVGASGVP